VLNAAVVAVVLVPLTETFTSGTGEVGLRDVTAGDGADGWLLPIALVATTVNV